MQRGRKGISALPHPPGPNRGHPRWADTPPSTVPCLPLSFFFLSLMCLCIWCACLCVFVLGVHVSVCLCMCVLVYVCQESSLPSSLKEAISVDSRAHSTANPAPRCAPEVLCCFLSAGTPGESPHLPGFSTSAGYPNSGFHTCRTRASPVHHSTPPRSPFLVLNVNAGEADLR